MEGLTLPDREGRGGSRGELLTLESQVVTKNKTPIRGVFVTRVGSED